MRNVDMTFCVFIAAITGGCQSKTGSDYARGQTSNAVIAFTEALVEDLKSGRMIKEPHDDFRTVVQELRDSNRLEPFYVPRLIELNAKFDWRCNEVAGICEISLESNLDPAFTAEVRYAHSRKGVIEWRIVWQQKELLHRFDKFDSKRIS
jgi:hypothetical protein